MASIFSPCSPELRFPHTRSLRCVYLFPLHSTYYHTLLGHHRHKASHPRFVTIRSQSGNSRSDVARAESDISSCAPDVCLREHIFLPLSKLIGSAGPQAYHMAELYHQNVMAHPYAGKVDLKKYPSSWDVVERDRFRDDGCRKAHILSHQLMC
jgi:hypothetical protein